ncbi:hypothetical protein [Roseovarius sp. ZX-A-9]|uniref:hypothetical protein n=1 Tax=Roseovarius sp. ZX-A-9 TaxID=3014783 RepID=UPI00232BA223|nr:hypothetical protein [Roseovarius sp. ZX-A-9]
MRRGNMPSAPDYTNAALAMGLVNLIWIFFVLWVSFGLPFVLLAGYGLNLLIDQIRRRG